MFITTLHASCEIRPMRKSAKHASLQHTAWHVHALLKHMCLALLLLPTHTQAAAD